MTLRKDIPAAVRSRTRIARGGAMYLAVTLLILAAAIYSQANTLFWALGLMIGGLVVSVVASWWMLRGLGVQRVVPTHGVAGEAMVLRYELVNRHRWLPAFAVVVGETFGRGSGGWRTAGPLAERPARLKGRPLGWVMHVGPRQRVQAEAPCWPLRRGPLRFERVVLSTTFPLGVIRRVREFEQPAEVLIYPRLVRLDRRTLFRLGDEDPHGVMKMERGGGHEEFFGLREYRPGDSLKMIDWRRTARTGELISREMTQPSPPRMLIALDLSGRRAAAIGGGGQNPPGSAGAPNDEAPDDEAVEKAVSLTASLVCDGYFHGYQIGLVVLGAPCAAFPVHHSLPHRTRMLEALAQLDTTATSDKPRALPARPNVVVRPRAAAAAGDPREMVLAGQDMDRYVVSPPDGVGSALDRRAGPPSRRQEIDREASWR